MDNKNKLNFSWKRFTEEDFNKKKNELINKKDWNGPALIDVGAVNIELHDPEYSSAGGEPRVFLDYYIGGDTSDNPYSDNLQDVPYGHADGSSIPISKIISLSYEEFKSYLESEVTAEFSRINNAENKILLEAERPTVNFDDRRQGAELYITKLAEKVDLAEQKDRRTWQFVRDNHPGYHDDLTIKTDQIFSDNDVYRSVVAGEMSVEDAEKFVELRGTKADFAREFIKTEKEILDDAIENWQPTETDERGEPVCNVPDYVQEFHKVVKDAYDEMYKMVENINMENDKDKFVKSFSGWEWNTDLEIDDKKYDQYFIYPTENLEGIEQKFDKDGKPTTSLRLVVDIDQETNEIAGNIEIDRLDDIEGDVDANNVESELTMYGHKILNEARNEIKKYLIDGIERVEKEKMRKDELSIDTGSPELTGDNLTHLSSKIVLQEILNVNNRIKEQNLENMFAGKYSIDDANSRMTFRETLDFYNKEDADRPYEERLNHAVSRMLYYNLELPDDEAGEKRWKICDETAKEIISDKGYDDPDNLNEAQYFADKLAKKEFGYTWQEEVNELSKYFFCNNVLDLDGHPTDLERMIQYYEKNTPLDGHKSNLEKAVSHMLMFSIDDFKSLEPENYDDITQDGAAAELRGELCDRIASDLVSGKISDGCDEINKAVEEYSKEIAGREFEKLKESGRFAEAEMSAEKAALQGESNFYSKNFTAGEELKFASFAIIGNKQPEKLRIVLSQYVPKGSLSNEDSSLIDKYLFSDVDWLRFDKDKGDLYLQNNSYDGNTKFTKTSLKSVLELAIENAENAEDAGAVLTLQKRLNELRGFNQNAQKFETKENSTRKQATVQKETAEEDVFGDFVSKVKSEYKDLKLILRSAANVLKQLPPEKKSEVRNELLKRGAKTPESLAIVMKEAIKGKQQEKTQQTKSSERKRDDYGVER